MCLVFTYAPLRWLNDERYFLRKTLSTLFSGCYAQVDIVQCSMRNAKVEIQK